MNQDDASSIRSRKHSIWTRMYGRFDLDPGKLVEAGRTRVMRIIQPVTVVDDILRDPATRRATVEQTSSAVEYLTVPDAELWTLYGYDFNRSAGDRVVERVSVRPTEEDGGLTMMLDRFSAVAVRTFYLPVPLKLKQGWVLQLHGDGTGAADGNYDMTIFVEAEAVSY